MKTVLISICIGLMSINAFSQSKLAGAGKATKVGGSAASKVVTPKTPTKTATPVKKKTSQGSSSEKQDPNAKYAASGYMEITGMTFANADADGHKIEDYGASLFAKEVKFLKPKVFYRGLTTEEHEISVNVKIIDDEGKLKKGSASPEGYTYTNKLTIKPGSGNYIELLGWGTNSGGSYNAGQYTFEIWYNGNIIYQKGIRLYSGTTPIATSKIIKINGVSFLNKNRNGTVLTDASGTLYEGDVQYIHPRIYYTGLYSTDQSITLYYKYFKPSGSLIVGDSSPLCYSTKGNITVKPGSNVLDLTGWGSSSGKTYKEGKHKIEFWLDGEKIYETSFSVVKKDLNEKVATSSSGNHTCVDLGLPSKTKWATCNVGANSPEEFGYYYAWGETVVKNIYTHGNSKYYKKSKSSLIQNDVIDSRGNLKPAHDPAFLLWGGSWRMPTLEEMNELDELCKWEWTTMKSTSGFRVTGPNGNSIFLPATGWYNSASNGSLDCANERSEYWTSTIVEGDTESARCLFFMKPDSHYASTGHSVQRSRGLCIRPVTK